MANNTARREIVDGLNQFADTLEKIAATYDQIAALPSAQLLRRMEHASKHAPKIDPLSPTFAPQADRYVRELNRLANPKRTRWDPPKV